MTLEQFYWRAKRRAINAADMPFHRFAERILKWWAWQDRSPMSKAPFFSSQTADCKSPDEVIAWVQREGEDARRLGASWLRASWDADTGLALVEGWYSRPADPPPPRFYVTGEKAGHDQAEATGGA